MLASLRRDMIVSVAAAAVAPGLDKGLAIAAAHEKKAQTPDPKPGFRKYKVGDAEIVARYDGIREQRHDGKYVANGTTAEVKQALVAAASTMAFVPIPVTVFAIRLSGRLTRCDVGGGDQVQEFNSETVFEPGRMMANMKAAGINPKVVETILISRFHPDHIFGLVEKKTDAPAFPNAEIMLPTPQRPLARRIRSLIPNRKNVLQVDSQNEVVPGIHFIKCPGHTSGHTALHLNSGDEQLVISSDAAYVPALRTRHQGWRGTLHQDGAMAAASRRKLLDRVAADRMRICGSHFPLPGLNRIAEDGGGYALTPQDI
jgi:glyoxylase-like metal-dependent hydrolase (beta-lactamase superfamily II)